MFMFIFLHSWLYPPGLRILLVIKQSSSYCNFLELLHLYTYCIMRDLNYWILFNELCPQDQLPLAGKPVGDRSCDPKLGVRSRDIQRGNWEVQLETCDHSAQGNQPYKYTSYHAMIGVLLTNLLCLQFYLDTLVSVLGKAKTYQRDNNRLFAISR